MAGQLFGYFGAAAAAGSLLQLNADRIHSAFGIALMQASGTMQVVHGGDPPAKAIYGAFPNHGGLLAALLSKAGLDGKCDALEGVAGLYEMFYGGEYREEALFENLGRKSCVYTLLLCLFFLIFGTLILRFFGVSLAMVRIAGGIVLLKIGFALMSSSPPKNSSADGGRGQDTNIAFMPLAMPLMFGPGAIATVIGMASTIKHSPAEWSDFAARPFSPPCWSRTCV